MQYIFVALGFMSFLGFMIIKPRFQVLIALVIMTQGFDLAPPLLFNQLIWDYGAVLLFVPAIRLFLSKKNESIKPVIYSNFFKYYHGNSISINRRVTKLVLSSRQITCVSYVSRNLVNFRVD